MIWTPMSLYQSGRRVSDARIRPPDSKRIFLRNVVPYEKQHMVLMQFEHHGMTVEALHQVNILFKGIELTKEQRQPETHFKIQYRGQILFVEKPDVWRTPVVWRCSCPDFYFTFGFWNWEQGALFGPKPRPYTRTGNGAPRNPDHFPGGCKHCINSIKMMESHNMTQMKRR